MPQTVTSGALDWQRLAVLNRHPRDDRIQFEEETHTYTIDGGRTGWTSCTGFLHKFFGQFDANACIQKMMISPSWSTSRYYGMTAQEIKDAWAAKGKAASDAGTRMHLDIEHFYNAMPHDSLTTGALCNWSIEEGHAGMIADAWAPAAGAEWAYFLDYQMKHGLRFTPFRTEWLIFDEEHKVAGSIDMVYKKPDGTLAIYDWKRVENLKTDNAWQKGLGPLTHLPDTNYWHYSLQLNVYRYILQKHYGYTVSELALVVLHPINKTWQVTRLNIMEDEVRSMMEARARALALTTPENISERGDAPVVVFEVAEADDSDEAETIEGPLFS